MFNKKLSFLALIPVLSMLLFASPAAAKQVTANITGYEGFVKFISQGTKTPLPDGGLKWTGQIVLNFRIASDPRLTGINTIYANSTFDSAGTGPSSGAYLIEAGTFEWSGSVSNVMPMIYSTTNPCGGSSPFVKRCYEYEASFFGANMWLVFYPAHPDGGWAGTFKSTLAGFGADPHEGTASGVGIGAFKGLEVKSTSSGYSFTSTISKDH